MKTADVIHEKGMAGYPAIYLLTSEEQRALSDIKDATKKLGRKLFVWSYGKGLFNDEQQVKRGEEPKPIEDTEVPPMLMKAMLDPTKVPPKSIVVLRLFHHFLGEFDVQTDLKQIITRYKSTDRMLIVLTPVLKIPPELEKDFALHEIDLPDAAALDAVLSGITKNIPDEAKRPSPDQRRALVQAALGLTSTEAESAFSLSAIRPKIQGLPYWDPKIVMEEKVATLKKTGILEFIPVDLDGLTSVGGMDNLKSFVRKRKRAFTEEARAYGLPFPKGLLLLGIPGTGKSLGAKACSAEMGMPLLRLDMGAVYGSLMGESEANMRKALQVAERLSPCVLWVDEIEKGASTSDNDSGTSKRIQGTILTWMQDKKTAVWVYATANDVRKLPPELMRKGRFDELFSVDLPTKSEREEIFRIHLTRRKLEENVLKGYANAYNSLVQASEGFTGAEIENAIENAMFTAFDLNRQVEIKDIIDSLDGTIPQSITMREVIESTRKWCHGRTVPASKGDEEVNISLVEASKGRMLEA